MLCYKSLPERKEGKELTSRAFNACDLEKPMPTSFLTSGISSESASVFLDGSAGRSGVGGGAAAVEAAKEGGGGPAGGAYCC
jgi:hypothetical protein